MKISNVGSSILTTSGIIGSGSVIALYGYNIIGAGAGNINVTSGSAGPIIIQEDVPNTTPLSVYFKKGIVIFNPFTAFTNISKCTFFYRQIL